MTTITEPELDIETIEPVGLPLDALYEIIEGRFVEVCGTGTYGGLVGATLMVHLANHVRESDLGRVVFETLFRIRPKVARRPDLAFVSYNRCSKETLIRDTHVWDVIPDLMIEIVSKTDEAWAVLAKVEQYFEASARAVWLVYPNLGVVHAFDSFTQIRVLTRDDELDGGQVLPGFRLSLAQLFEGGATEAEAPASDD